jgi:cysteine desulfurase
MRRLVYLDNNATTMVDNAIFSQMGPYLCDLYGNAGATHFFGALARKHQEAARNDVAALIGAQPDEIVFTAGGTESDNTAIQSALRALPERKHIVTSRVEHVAVRAPIERLREFGYRVSEIAVDESGRFDLDQYAATVDEDTALVSLMWANNETGVLFPVHEAASMAKERGALFHTDAVQAVGKIPVCLAESHIDMLSVSAHKLHAPKGIGALFVRRGTPFAPLLLGGHQERNRRAGTENTAAIVAMGAACELAGRMMVEDGMRVGALRDRLETELRARIPRSRVLGGDVARLPNTLLIAFEHVDEDAALSALSDIGICASSGSACNARSMEPSHVLLAMCVPRSYLTGAIRFSLSRYSTDEEIDLVIERLPEIICRLRESSILGLEDDGD